MRLTLRTLLAYLDDSLEAPEAEELGKKIEESEFARALVHRMRSATRRLRLGAPKLSGKGMGLDPNTVAEYLDYTLASDRVPDFEQVCLESDVHLAEVAACHQILTNVLGGVADVDAALRDKIVALGDPSAARETPAEPEALQPTGAASGVGHVDHSILDDEPLPAPYQAVPRSMNWPAMAVVALLLLLGITLLVMGPLDERHPVLGRFLARQSSQTDKSEASSGEPEHRDARAESAASSNPEESPMSGQATGREPSDVTENGSAPASLPNDSASPPDSPVTRPEDAPADDAAPSEPTGREAPPTAADDEGRAPPKSGAAGQRDGAARPSERDVGATVPENAGDAAKREPVVMPPSRVAAKLTSANSILGRFDLEEETYFRVPSLATVDGGERLYAPPLFRPKLLVEGDSGLQLTLVGPTHITMPERPREEVKRFRLVSGRVLFARHAESLPTWEVEFAGRIYRLELEAPTTIVAVETYQAAPVGEDPATAERWRAIRVVPVDGPVRVTWNETEPVTVEAKQAYWQLDADAAVVRELAELPPWALDESLGALEASAAAEIEQLVALGRPLLLALHEAAAHRRVEVRSLAVESLAGAGEFWPFVDALGDRKLKAYWEREIDAVDAAIQSNAGYASRLEEVLVQRRSDDGKALYRMFWGYTNSQLEAGADRELVSYLEREDATDLRVLAFDRLKRITGMTFLFRPDRTPKSQRAALHKWREAATEGRIRHRSTPLPTWLIELKPDLASPMTEKVNQ